MNTHEVAQLRDMDWSDVDAVLSIEQQVNSHPWTRGNFNDALASGNLCKLCVLENIIVGYAILMPVLEEAHLLVVSIDTKHQRKGLATQLLTQLFSLLRVQKFESVLLEVRPSNLAAHALYMKAGFVNIGLRRGYYPSENGREDAIIMERKLT